MSEGGGKRSRDEPAAAAAAAAAESDSGTFFIDVPFYAFRPVGPARILTETGAFSIHPLFFFWHTCDDQPIFIPCTHAGAYMQ